MRPRDDFSVMGSGSAQRAQRRCFGFTCVFLDQPGDPVHTTLERDYVPGIGMVREVMISAANGTMLALETKILTDFK